MTLDVAAIKKDFPILDQEVNGTAADLDGDGPSEKPTSASKR